MVFLQQVPESDNSLALTTGATWRLGLEEWFRCGPKAYLSIHRLISLPPSSLLGHTWNWTHSAKEHILSGQASSEPSPRLREPHKGTRQKNQELASGPCSSQAASSKGLSLEALILEATGQGIWRSHLPSLPCFPVSQHLEVCAPLGGFPSMTMPSTRRG